MQPYDFKTAGGYTRTTTNSGGTTLVWKPVSFARRRYLSCVSRKGDFETPTPFSFTKGEESYPKGVSRMSDVGWAIIEEGYGAGASGPVTPANSFTTDADDPYNKCLQKLFGKVRRDVDLSIDLYQGNQTLRMVAGFAKAIRHPIDTAVKLNRRFIRRNKMVAGSKLVGSKWLEWQYGIRPTYQTIYELTSDLVGALSEPGGIQLARARASSTRMLTRTPAGGKHPWHSVIPAVVKERHSRRCEVALYYTIGDADLNALSQFTSLNPASFVYENIPYSFVLDWFVDIGGYIRMMETALATGLLFKSGYITRTTWRQANVAVSGSASQYGTTYTANLTGDCFVKTLDRRLLASMPTPNLPSFKCKLGTERLLSAASLLTQFLGDWVYFNPPKRHKSR